MRLLQFIFFLNFVLVLDSCQQTKEGTTAKSERIVSDDDVAGTDRGITPSSSEDHSQVITEDLIVVFYNNVLGRLYPNRKLSAQYESQAITVSPDALENIEGGGMSTKYLRVVDEIDLEVGTIIYETNTSPFPITLSIAILEEGNFLVSPLLIDINGQVVLRISSNDSGNLDMGPYDYIYFTYDDFVILRPIYTKKMVDETTSRPLLSVQDKEEVLKKMALNNVNNGANYSQEEMIEVSQGEFISRDFDKMKYQPIIDELKGIEKHYVQNDLFKLNSLLRFNNDDRFQALENDLKAKYEEKSIIKIHLLDTKNGYIEFERLQTIVVEECKQSMVYWNKSDGGILIAHEMNCCTMFCDGSISFESYDKESQSYVSIDSKEIVPQIDSLKSLQPINYIEGDGFDTKYTLPQKGKNIRYCVESNCLELVWQDGIFSIEE
jgi:hypothetical protein